MMADVTESEELSAGARDFEAVALWFKEMRDNVLAARAYRRSRLQVALSVLESALPAEQAERCWRELDEWDKADEPVLAALEERIEWASGMAVEFRAEARRRRLAS
jgi:hypothetical protein